MTGTLNERELHRFVLSIHNVHRLFALITWQLQVTTDVTSKQDQMGQQMSLLDQLCATELHLATSEVWLRQELDEILPELLSSSIM